MTRDEDDGHVRPISGDALLQLETVEARERHVEDQAARSTDAGASEEFLRGCEQLRLPTGVADQQVQRFAHRDIVVDDEHDWCRVRHAWVPRSASQCGSERPQQIRLTEGLEQTRYGAPFEQAGT